MTSHWNCISLTQGNFDVENSLISRQMMYYRPFGCMEEYQPLFDNWMRSRDHYVFENHPLEVKDNYQLLVKSVVVLMEVYDIQENVNYEEVFMRCSEEILEEKVKEMYRSKLGISMLDRGAD